MNEIQLFKYEVAFSFLQQDEAIAYDINDRIQDRLSTFIYSKKQEELGGTDGEKKFNNVFYSESRIVVVLYRDKWGETSWTRIEELAIKNRAFDKGWDFLLLLNLENKSTLPSWIPKSYIWLNFQRYKVEGAIAVIEHKVLEIGGQTRHETIAERAERLKRKRIAEKERGTFLNSQESVTAANEEMISLINKFKKASQYIKDPSTNLILSSSERTVVPLMYQIGYYGYYLCFNNCKEFSIGILNGIYTLVGELRVLLYEKIQINPFETGEKIIEISYLRFDRDLIGTNGWSDNKTGQDFISTDELLDKWIKKFIGDIETKYKNRS